MNKSIAPIIHVGFVVDEAAATYTAYLINPTDYSYSAIRVLTGAFQGDEDILIETSRQIRDLGPLAPHSASLLENSDIDGLEFVIWYHLDLWIAQTAPPILLQFSLPKYHWLTLKDYKERLNILPVLNQQGYRIDLSERQDNLSIEAEHLASIPTATWGMKTIHFTPRVRAALDKAEQLHKGQTRKSLAIPYITHPINVATIVAGYTLDEDVIIAAYLHDTLEDCDYSLVQLKHEFGERVASIVAEVTEDIELKHRLGSRASWQERKQKYLEHLKVASQEALLVATADKIDNLNTMSAAYKLKGAAIWEAFSASPDKQLWFYGQVLALLRERLKSPIVDELKQAYRKVEAILIK
ncbi:MAG: HD domain-containing protein [Candidatus Veblenbacteria bacterium]|nr:HD domain-containing protein [Candidatus Veblenbacteria bacterium]